VFLLVLKTPLVMLCLLQLSSDRFERFGLAWKKQSYLYQEEGAGSDLLQRKRRCDTMASLVHDSILNDCNRN